MLHKIIFITIVIIVYIILFENKKLRVLPILLKQLQVFKNAKTEKI